MRAAADGLTEMILTLQGDYDGVYALMTEKGVVPRGFRPTSIASPKPVSRSTWSSSRANPCSSAASPRNRAAVGR